MVTVFQNNKVRNIVVLFQSPLPALVGDGVPEQQGSKQRVLERVRQGAQMSLVTVFQNNKVRNR